MAEELIARQHDLLRLICNATENLKKLGSAKITKGAVQVRLDQLDRNWSKFEDQHEDVMIYKNDSKFKGDVYFTEDVYASAETAYYENKAEFLDLLDQLITSSSVGGVQNVVANAPSGSIQKSLPKITLPKFSGRYQEWTPFKDMFLSLVGNNDSLSAVENLHHLKCSLLGDAAKLISAIPVTEENYERAGEKLQLRYENKRALVNAQLDTLFSIKPLTKKSARDLDQLRSAVYDVLEALRALGGEVQHWDFFIVYFVCHRLDPETHEAWELELGNSTETPKYEDLNTFLESRIRALENIDARSLPQRSSPSNHGGAQRSTPARTVHTATPSRRHQNTSCACCNSNHYVSLCPDYRAKTPEQRRDLIAEKRLCYNCLGNHLIASCVSTKRCLVCGQQHHTTLHPRGSPSTSPTAIQSGSSSTGTTPSGNSQQPSGSANACHATTFEESSSKAILATALVGAVSSSGRRLCARALLDQGSELTFVCESVVQALRLPRRSANIPLSGIGAQVCVTTRGVVTLRLQHRSNPKIEVTVDAHILSRLTGRIPSQVIPAEAFAHLSDLELADPSFAVPGPIDILLGANIYAHLLQEDIRKADICSPVAQRTLLGWVISGPFSTASQTADSIVAARSFCCVPDQDLSKVVEQFWAQEQIPRSVRSEISKDDRWCEEHFQRTHSRDSDGRYTVRLPLKSLPGSQEESQRIANRMLMRMHGRFECNAVLKTMYTDFLVEYYALGHMEKLEPSQLNEAYFLSHHGVVRDTSISTKLRVVFNASQKTKDGSTLNDFLHAGPKLQTDLMDVLLR